MSINFEDLDDGEAALNDMTVEGEVQRVSRQHVSASDFIRLAQRSEETTSHQKLSHEQHHGNTTFHGPDRPPEDRKKRPKKARKLHLARLAHLDGDTKARVDRSVQTAHVKSWLHSHGYVVKADKLHPAVARLIADWFNLVDQDGSRTLEHHELLAALKAARVPCDDATISEMIQMMDMNKDGVIDWDEFEVFMTEEFAAGKSLLSGEYLLPSGATINFGVMIGQLKRNRLLTDIMQDAQRRSKWASIAANPDALRRELAMLQEAAEVTSLATLERAKRSDASGGGRPTTPRGVLAAAMMRSAPDGLGGVVPGSGGSGGGAGWGQQQQSAVAAEVMARTVRIRDKLRASAVLGWEHHAASQYTASAAAEYDKAASDDACLAYGGYGHGSAGPSAVAALAAGAAGTGMHGTHPWRGPACPDPTSQGASTLPSHSHSHSQSGQLRLDGSLGGSIGGYLYGLSTAAAAASTANNNSCANYGSNSPLASPRACTGDDLMSISSAAAVSGLFALTSVSSGEHLAVQRQIAAVPPSPHRSTDPLIRPHRPAVPSALLGPCPRADFCSPETSAWLLTGRDGAHRATAAATGGTITATGFAASPGFQGAGSSAATPARNHSTPPAFRRSPARTAPGPVGPGSRLQECNSEPRHVLMPTVASLRQRRPLSRTMSHVAEMANTLRAQTVRLPPEALDPANTLPAAMLAGCAFKATTTTAAAAARAGPGTGALTQPFRSSYNVVNNSSNNISGNIGSTATVGANRGATAGATSGRFPTVDGYVPAARSFERQGSSVTQGSGGGAAAVTFTALQRPATAAIVTADAAESALGGDGDGDVGAAYSYGLTPAVLPAANTEYSQIPIGQVVDSVAAAGGVVSETSVWGTTAAAAMTAAVGGPSGGRPSMAAATGFGSYLPELAHSFAEERHSQSGPLTFGHTTTTVEPADLSERLLSFSVYDSPFAQEDGADSPAHQAANDRHGNTPPAPPPQHPPLYASASASQSQQLLYSGSLPSSTAVLQHNFFSQGPGDKALRPSASLARNRTGGPPQPPPQSPLIAAHSSLTSPVPILRQQPPLYIIGSPSVSRTTSPPRVASDATACSNSISGGASGPAPSITSSCSSFPPSVASQGSLLLAPAPAGTVDATPGLLAPNNSLPELPGSAPRRDGGGVGIGVGGGVGGSRRRGDESGPAARRPHHHYGGRGRTLAQQLSVRSADADLTRQLADITCGPWASLGDSMGRPGSETPPVAERSAPAAVAGASLAAASAAAAAPAAVGASTSATGSSGLSFAAARAGGGGKGAAAADSGVKRHTPSPFKTVSTPVVNLGAQGTASTVSSAPCSACTANTTATTTSAGTAATASATSTIGGGGTGGNVTPLGSMSGSEVMAWPTTGGDGANLISSPHSGTSCTSGGTATSSSRPATTASALLGPQASSASATTVRDVGSPSRTRPPAIPEVKMAPNWGASTASLLQLRLAKHLDELLPRS